MAVSNDILATWRGPGRIMRRLLTAPASESRALSYLLFAAILFFIAQAPWQAREAHLSTEVPLQARLYWSALLLVFLMPLAIYLIAALLALVARVMRLPVRGYAIRLTLFWSLLAITPAALLAGLTAAFVGPGAALQLISLAGLAALLWFWVSGLRVAAQPGRPGEGVEVSQ